jgi:PAS domain S-box-containing protein
MEASRSGPPKWEAELFRLLIENSTDYAVFVVGLDGSVLTWNPGAERVLGYREDEIVGKSSFVLFTPEDQAAGIPEAELRVAVAEGRATDDRWHLRKDGTRLWVSGVMTLLREESGWPRACAKVMRDFTQAKLAYGESPPTSKYSTTVFGG